MRNTGHAFDEEAEDDRDKYDQEEHEERLREHEYNEECERAYICTCGSYVFVNNKPLHVSDCICGAD